MAAAPPPVAPRSPSVYTLEALKNPQPPTPITSTPPPVAAQQRTREPTRGRYSDLTYTEEVVSFRCVQRMVLGISVGTILFVAPRFFQKQIPVKIPWIYGITFPISGLLYGYVNCREEVAKMLPEDSDVRKSFPRM